MLSNQVQLNLVHQDPVDDLMPWAQATGHAALTTAGRAYRPRTGVPALPALLKDKLPI